MTSNTRVVVIGAGLTGARPARRPGEPGTPVESGRPPTSVGDEEHRAWRRVPLAGTPAGRDHAPEVTTRTAGRADGTAIAYDAQDAPDRPHPLIGPPRPLHLLTNDGGS
ncbi:hypothetical protein ACWGKQ_33675 [Streptomyces sp. NPDC054770]